MTISTFLIFETSKIYAQYDSDTSMNVDLDEDDLNIGGDIFSDFNEDLEVSQVLEDERFYRYGRFYSANISAGLTAFTGNRGAAYQNKQPSLAISLVYFMNFQMAFGLGVGYSKHIMIIDVPTKGFINDGPGLIETSMFRSFFFYRYYLDTYDLGTAITYSNPYLVGNIEYWDQTNKYMDHPDFPNDSGGGLGASFGLGLEFPIKIRESYIGVEALYHFVNFKDSTTQLYRPKDPNSGGGYSDLTGNVITVFLSYVISW